MKKRKRSRTLLPCNSAVGVGGEFELIAEESTCSLEKVKNEDGWADEIMAHMIRCKHCGQIFTCVVNTWRGSGHFKKGKG